MPPSFSPRIRLALALSYPPWITSTLIWLRLLKIRAIPYLFMQHSLLERKPSIGTTTKLTTLRFTGLLWVHFLHPSSFRMQTHQVLVLHPRHKSKYFRTAGWEEEWIETAHSIVHEEFDQTYAFMDVAGEDQANKVC